MKKNNKIILVSPPNNMKVILGKGRHLIHATEPLGILSIAAVLEKNGFNVEILDAFALGYSIEEITDIEKE